MSTNVNRFICEGRIAKLYRAYLNEGETLAILEGITAGDCAAAYHDWINNYLTREHFAEVHGLSLKYTNLLLDVGRRLAAGNVPFITEDEVKALAGVNPDVPAWAEW